MQTDAYILIVEDDKDIAQLVAQFLERNGLRVSTTGSAGGLERALKTSEPDLLVVDLMLPDEDGLTLIRRLRERRDRLRHLPVIIVTAMREETDRIVGLEIGADDYIGKPFSPRELLARIRAVLRRVQQVGETTQITDGTYCFCGWTLRPLMRELTDPNGASVTLTSAEFDLLQVLCENPRQILSRDQLVDLTHGRNATPFDRSIDTLVSRIRRKIEQDPKCPDLLKTVRLGGYVLTAEVTRR